MNCIIGNKIYLPILHLPNCLYMKNLNDINAGLHDLLEEPNKELLDYFRYIDSLAKSGQPTPYLNSSEIHAVIVLSRIFKYAKEYIYLFSGRLSEGIASHPIYLKELDGFLGRGGQLKVLLEEYLPNENTKLFNLLNLDKTLSRVDLKTHSFKLTSKETENQLHFCVADDCAYRLETNVKTYTASGSFNDRIKSGQLKDIFDEIYAHKSSEKHI